MADVQYAGVVDEDEQCVAAPHEDTPGTRERLTGEHLEMLRLEALVHYGLAPTGPDAGRGGAGDGAAVDEGLGELDNLVRLATQLCAVPYGTINIITASEQHQIAPYGMEPRSCSREDSMCARILSPARTVIVEDCRLDPRFAENPFVTGELGKLRFYASTPIISADGHALGTLCVFDLVPGRLNEQQVSGLQTLTAQIIDVLDLQLRTRELRAAMEELRRSNELLAEFAGRVSHDLRGPLSAVLGMAELAQEETSVADNRVASAYFTRIYASTRRMTGMVEDLLAYSRVDGALSRQVVDLEQLAAVVQQDLAPTLAAAGAVITVESFSGEADPVQLSVLLQNLVQNALAYRNPDRAPRISISAGGTVERWHLTVADNGRGIPAVDRARVLDPLVRLNRPGDPEGSGLGLSTCARIAQAHGGRLELGDTAGGGLTVKVRIQSADGSGAQRQPAASAVGYEVGS